MDIFQLAHILELRQVQTNYYIWYDVYKVVINYYSLMIKDLLAPLEAFIPEDYIQKAILNPLQDEQCCDLHPGVSCNVKMLYQFAMTCKNLYKTYLLVHLIPFIIFKRKKFINKPAKELKSLVKGFVKSMMFVGFYAVIVKRTVCFMTKYYKFSSLSAAVGGFLGGAALLFEPESRQAEIALYCVNKTLETLYNIAKRRNYSVNFANGECLVIGIAVGLICYMWVDCNKAFHSKYSKVLERLIGSI